MPTNPSTVPTTALPSSYPSSDPPPISSPPLPPPFDSSDPQPILLTQGAEALLYRTHFLNPSIPCALKHRPSKPYRHPILDLRLTRHRILSEARTLVKLRREGVSVPGVLGVEVEGPDREEKNAGGWMLMEWVEGRTAKEVLLAGARRVKEGKGIGKAKWEEDVGGLMGKIGKAVGEMHRAGVVHGDLTTSNLMLRLPPHKTVTNGDGAAVQNEEEELRTGEIVLIDFGLSAQTVQDEDRAVDLYVLERAFGSTHPEIEGQFQEVLRAYGRSCRGAEVVLKKLLEVRMRGRKRSMLG